MRSWHAKKILTVFFCTSASIILVRYSSTQLTASVVLLAAGDWKHCISNIVAIFYLIVPKRFCAIGIGYIICSNLWNKWILDDWRSCQVHWCFKRKEGKVILVYLVLNFIITWISDPAVALQNYVRKTISKIQISGFIIFLYLIILYYWINFFTVTFKRDRRLLKSASA